MASNTGTANRISLSPKKILHKQFNIARKNGYNADQVDDFLDLVASDYQTFANMLNESYAEIERLQNENKTLKQKLNQQAAGGQASQAADVSNVNVDMLRRLSQLEKEVYGKKD